MCADDEGAAGDQLFYEAQQDVPLQPRIKIGKCNIPSQDEMEWTFRSVRTDILGKKSDLITLFGLDAITISSLVEFKGFPCTGKIREAA